MKKNLKFLSFILVISMIISLASVSFIFAGKTADEASTEKEVKTIGEKNNDAISFKLKNSTGMDIDYINMYDESDYDPQTVVFEMQEALIEQGYLDDTADGSIGPKTTAAIEAFRKANDLDAGSDIDDEFMSALIKDYDDGNMLEKDDVFEKDSARLFYYKAEEAEETAAADDDSEMIMNPAYIIVIHVVNGDNPDTYDEYVIHNIPIDDTDEVVINFADDVVYISYVSKTTGEEISTLEAEKAIIEQNQTADVTYDDSYYDDGYYDDGYYDDGYYDDGYYDDGYYDDGYYDDTSYDDVSYDDTSYDDSAQGADGCIEDGLFY